VGNLDRDMQRVLEAIADPAEGACLRRSVRAGADRIHAYAGIARGAVERPVRTG
jgi:hypothetical protein